MAGKLTPKVGKHDHLQGPDTASITLVEYGDYECPYCGEEYPIVKAIQKRLGKRLRYGFRHFPLANAHPHAEHAAEAAEAAGAQGKFWEMHDTLYENQDALGEERIMRLAQELKLDVKTFVSDLETRKFKDRVRH